MSGRDLHQLQAIFQEAVSGPSSLEKKEIEQLIVPSAKLDAASHLAIYRRGYFARLLDCLGKQFQVLKLTLGEELFNDFALDYLAAFPSQSYTLNDLGSRFAAFLENSRPDKDEAQKEEWIDFMIELAKFEWALFLLFDLPGNEGKPYANPADRDEELRLQPCFSLHAFTFPVAAYYNKAANGILPDHPPRHESRVALVRTNFTTGIFGLKPAAYSFLKAMQDGKSVAESLSVAASETGIGLAEIQSLWKSWRSAWMKAGFFVAAQRL